MGKGVDCVLTLQGRQAAAVAVNQHKFKHRALPLPARLACRPADTLRLLLVLGSRCNLPDKEGCTPLHWAAIRGHIEACNVLLQVRQLAAG